MTDSEVAPDRIVFGATCVPTRILGVFRPVSMASDVLNLKSARLPSLATRSTYASFATRMTGPEL